MIAQLESQHTNTRELNNKVSLHGIEGVSSIKILSRPMPGSFRLERKENNLVDIIAEYSMEKHRGTLVDLPVGILKFNTKDTLFSFTNAHCVTRTAVLDRVVELFSVSLDPKFELSQTDLSQFFFLEVLICTDQVPIFKLIPFNQTRIQIKLSLLDFQTHINRLAQFI